MKKLIKRNLIIKLLPSLILVILLFSEGSLAVTTSDWIETFDDQTSLEDWESSFGQFSINETDGTLVSGSNCYTGGDYLETDYAPLACMNYLTRNSTATVGTWSFDVFLPTGMSNFIFYFMGSGSFETLYGGYHPNSGYYLIVSQYTISLKYTTPGMNSNDAWYYSYIEKFEYSQNRTIKPNLFGSWSNFRITRDSENNLELFLNNMLLLHGTNTLFNTSQIIHIEVPVNAKLDNISFTNEKHESNNAPSFEVPIILGSIMIATVLRKKLKK